MAQHMKATGTNGLQRVIRAFETLMLVFAALFIGCLALAAPFVTGYFVYVLPDSLGADVMNLLTPVNGGAFISFIIPLLVSLLLVAALTLLWRSLRRVSAATVVAVMLILLLACAVGWVVLLGTDTNFYADSVRLDQYARALLAGDRAVFSADLGDQGLPYLSVYPFQSGLVWLLAGVYAVFGVGNQMAFQLLNVIFVVMTAASLIFITGRLFPCEGTVAVASVLAALFLPLMFSAAFVYGNAIGFGLCCMALALNIAAMQRPDSEVARWALFAAGALCLLLSLIVKSTFVIVLIALAMAWAIVFVRERRYAQILIVLATVVVVNGATSVPVHMLESVAGVDFGDGMPKTSWIAMGLSWDPFIDRPGWWSPVQAAHYAAVDGNASAQGAFALESIRGSVGSFIADPIYCMYFFVYKIMTEWLDPTFQSLYYSATSVSDVSSSLVGQVVYNGFTVNRILVIFMDAYQSVYYLFALIGFVCAIRHRSQLRKGTLFVVICLLGGIACYLLWEAKSVYIMPFALLLLPFSAYGAQSAFAAVSRMRA